MRKSVYPYQYMDDWEKLNKTSLPEKEDFYTHLNMERITDADYAHAKTICHDLCVLSMIYMSHYLSICKN